MRDGNRSLATRSRVVTLCLEIAAPCVDGLRTNTEFALPSDHVGRLLPLTLLLTFDIPETGSVSRHFSAILRG